MCGIVCALDLKQSSDLLRSQVLEMSKKVRHRGPDWNGIHCGKNVLLAHERLAIVDPASGNQPIYSDDRNLILAANGEIYNHQELRTELKTDYIFQTNSDCEIILALYKEKGVNFIDDLNGIFGFVLYDEINDEYLIARDHMGIIPLYMGWDKQGTFYVASELKALEGTCNKIEIFPPGHFMSSKDNKMIKWYERDWMNFESVKDNDTDLEELQIALEDAVHRQLMSDVPYGVLLSGGLDSSITSALAKKYSKNRVESNDVKSAWYPQLHSFAVGLKGSPDLIAAQKVAFHTATRNHLALQTANTLIVERRAAFAAQHMGIFQNIDVLGKYLLAQRVQQKAALSVQRATTDSLNKTTQQTGCHWRFKQHGAFGGRNFSATQAA